MTRTAILHVTIFTVLMNSINCQFGYQQYGNQQRNQNTHSRVNPQQQNLNFGFNQPQNQFNQQDFVFPNYQQSFYPQNQNQNYRPNHHNHHHHNHEHNHNQNNFNQQPQIPVKPAATQKIPTTHQPFTQPISSHSNRIDERISQAKCNEYAKLIKKKIQVASLSLDSAVQDISVTDCDAVTGLVVGGKDANPHEFPHQAAIGYPNFDGEISFRCGGSLISEKFVLTCAHCSTADRTSPTVVRLGDLNLKTRETGLPEVDIPIQEFINHEAYNRETRENDIALIKMTQPATFSRSIRPACLQQTENISKTKAVATGWGYTEVGGKTSDILQKVQLDIIANQQCSSLYNDEENYHIYPSQICAGVLKGGKDTCGGDSGGPLQIAKGGECVFTIIGLTSYGSTYCGGQNMPGIYTRVSSYIDWIESKAWAA